MTTNDRRLIEDYLPLDALNAIASNEKLHPRRYVELIHYWPARRPISACRAAIFATLTPPPPPPPPQVTVLTREGVKQPHPSLLNWHPTHPVPKSSRKP